MVLVGEHKLGGEGNRRCGIGDMVWAMWWERAMDGAGDTAVLCTRVFGAGTVVAELPLRVG